MELKIFNLIRSGKSRNDILAEKVTTPANLAIVLSGIYQKTDALVKYRSARTKFEELACYLRNNPDVFGPIPKVAKAEEDEEKRDCKKAIESVAKDFSTPEIIQEVEKAVGRISTKLKAKLEVLDEVCAEIVKELGNVR